jgi:hypothetical protein
MKLNDIQEVSCRQAFSLPRIVIDYAIRGLPEMFTPSTGLLMQFGNTDPCI